MAKKSMDAESANPTASEIAESALPGWKARREFDIGSSEAAQAEAFVDQAQADSADAVMPSLERLRAKYLGLRDGPVDASPESSPADGGISLVELEAGPIRKTVAVSTSRRKVLWSQG